MKLHSITLHNYRKFKHAEISFPEGIIGLIGHNGTGKSTIIEAVGWAIYGNKAARTTKEFIKRQNALPNEDCWVKLEFEIGGDRYEVTRIMSGKSLAPDAHVKVNGMVAASSADGSTKFLEKKIGMDADSFFISLVAKQKELNALSTKTPGERKKSMLRMLKIDAIEDAIKKVRQDKRGKEERLEGIKSGLKDIDELKKEMEEWKDARGKSMSLLKIIQAEIGEIEKKVAQLEEMWSKEKKKFEEYNSLERERSLFQERLESKKKQLEEKRKEREELERRRLRYKEIFHYEEEYKKIRREREELEKVREAYVKKKEIEKELKLICDEKKKLDEIIFELNKKIKEGEEIRKKGEELEVEERKLFEGKKEMEGGIKIKQIQIKHIEDDLEEWKKKKDEIEKMGPESSCPTCGRILGEKYEEIVENFSKKIGDGRKKIKEMEKEMEELKEGLKSIEGKMEELEKEKEEIEKEMKELVKAEKELNHYVESKKEKEMVEEEKRKEMEKLGEVKFDEVRYEEVKRKSMELEKIQEEIFVLKSEIQKIPQLDEVIEEMHSDIKFISMQLEEVHKKMDALDFSKEKYKEVEREYEEGRKELQEKREDRIKIQGEISQIEREIERLSKEIEEQKKQREKIKELRKEIQILEILAGERDTGLLNDFKRYLISRIGPLLSSYASTFFSIFTGGKYNDIEIDENYEIFIYDNGERFSITRFSGGEEDLANLSLRLAISQLIAQRAGNIFQFIALDEIFGSQDIERRRNVLRALGELSNQFSQIVLITHIEDIKDSLQHIINVFEDEHGISHVAIE